MKNKRTKAGLAKKGIEKTIKLFKRKFIRKLKTASKKPENKGLLWECKDLPTGFIITIGGTDSLVLREYDILTKTYEKAALSKIGGIGAAALEMAGLEFKYKLIKP